VFGRRTPLREGDGAFGPRNRKARVLEDEYDWQGSRIVKIQWLDTNEIEILYANMLKGTGLF